jgi:hypothetical protein
MSETEFERRGTSYVLTIPALNTSLWLRHMKLRSGEWHAVFSVRTAIGGAKTLDGNGLLIDGVSLNLGSWAAHGAAAKQIDIKAGTGGKVDWLGLVDELCMRASAAREQGDEMEEVGNDPVTPDHERVAIDPLVVRNAASVIYGAGGGGKSFLGYALALSVRLGREIVPGCPPAIKGPVCYFDWETDRRTANDRIQKLKRGMGLGDGSITYLRLRRPIFEIGDELAEKVAKTGAVFVVIDPAERAIGQKGEHSDLTDAAMRLFEVVDLFGPVSTLILDHVPKSELGQRGGGNGPIGAVAKENTARLTWRLFAQHLGPKVTDLTLSWHKANDVAWHPPIGLRLTFDGPSARFDPTVPARVVDSDTAEYAGAERPSAAAMIRELLDDPKAGYKATDIARLLNLNPTTVRSTLNRSGEFEKDASDVWRLRTGKGVSLHAVPGASEGPQA